MKLILPVNGCGIRFDENNGIITISVSIVAQMDQKLQQKFDLETVAKCNLPRDMMNFQYKNKEPRNGLKNYI